MSLKFEVPKCKHRVNLPHIYDRYTVKDKQKKSSIMLVRPKNSAQFIVKTKLPGDKAKTKCNVGMMYTLLSLDGKTMTHKSKLITLTWVF